MDWEKDIDLENLISGTAFKKRFHKDPRTAEQLDPVWDELARTLAHGLRNSIVHWSPDVIVLGGAMMLGCPLIPISSVENELRRIQSVYPELPALRKAALGDHNGLYGAMEFLRS